jgi:hypothetical protein
MYRVLTIALMAVALAAGPPARASDAVHFDALDPATYDVSRESVVQLLCQDPDSEQLYLSRAVVLDARPGERPDFDVLLATRHALYGAAGQRQCRIRGVPEWRGEIVDVRSGTPDPQNATDFSADWAILRTRGRLPGDVPRMRVLSADGEHHGELSLLVRPVDRAPCDVRQPPDYLPDPNLIVHGCATRHGLSGTPLVAQVGDEPFVVALHVGRALTIDAERREELGIARRLSGDFLTTLAEYLADQARE